MTPLPAPGRSNSRKVVLSMDDWQAAEEIERAAELQKELEEIEQNKQNILRVLPAVKK
jgi:hypothetical protein